MAKVNVTNLELSAILGEFQNFTQMFPAMAKYLLHAKFQDFQRKNGIYINLLQEKQKKLFEDNIVFKDGQPMMEQVESKIIDIGGKPKEQSGQDFKYKSEEHKEAFMKGSQELMRKNCVIEI